MQNGAHWKSLKRFTLKGLRNFGLGKSSLEEKIGEEVEVVLAEFDTKQGVPFYPKRSLAKLSPTLFVPSYLAKGRCNFNNIRLGVFLVVVAHSYIDPT